MFNLLSPVWYAARKAFLGLLPDHMQEYLTNSVTVHYLLYWHVYFAGSTLLALVSLSALRVGPKTFTNTVYYPFREVPRAGHHSGVTGYYKNLRP